MPARRLTCFAIAMTAKTEPIKKQLTDLHADVEEQQRDRDR